jgi:hypothetical protein
LWGRWDLFLPCGGENPPVCRFFTATFPFFLFGGFLFFAILVGYEEDDRKCAKVSEMCIITKLDLKWNQKSAVSNSFAARNPKRSWFVYLMYQKK